MGLTVLELEVGNPANPRVTESVEFLIDSGAIYSVVPASTLTKLGIEPLVDQEFRLANGDKIVRKKGIALFKYGERIGGADVVFGEEGDSILLGAFTLEALGLSLDPLRRELKALPMLLAVLSARSLAPAPLPDVDDAPPGHVLQYVHLTARPAHLDRVGLAERPQTEVEPQVVVRVVARLAERRPCLPAPPGGDDHGRPQPRPV